ncbi:hypothetical protein AMTR_s00038p00214680 [Amborella trichopoda]|uniref:Uncharacterized protein n=1 Tax=Amborella trichopoda TaxID=13333 RepID=U5CZW7_AMBTC|nr:hypothetical protein AMTR_s00038p00214680 [Amborella trichopoda]
MLPKFTYTTDPAGLLSSQSSMLVSGLHRLELMEPKLGSVMACWHSMCIGPTVYKAGALARIASSTDSSRESEVLRMTAVEIRGKIEHNVVHIGGSEEAQHVS